MTLTNAVIKELTHADIFDLIKQGNMSYSEFSHCIETKLAESYYTGYDCGVYDTLAQYK